MHDKITFKENIEINPQTLGEIAIIRLYNIIDGLVHKYSENSIEKPALSVSAFIDLIKKIDLIKRLFHSFKSGSSAKRNGSLLIIASLLSDPEIFKHLEVQNIMLKLLNTLKNYKNTRSSRLKSKTKF